MEQLDHPEKLEVEMPDQSAMWKKAQEFFQTCDSEGKGFIARTDMQVTSSSVKISKERKKLTSRWPSSKRRKCISLEGRRMWETWTMMKKHNFRC